MLEKCCYFLEEYRKTGFKKVLVTASDLAKELQIEPVFKPMKRVQRIKRQKNLVKSPKTNLSNPQRKCLKLNFPTNY